MFRTISILYGIPECRECNNNDVIEWLQSDQNTADLVTIDIAKSVTFQIFVSNKNPAMKVAMYLLFYQYNFTECINFFQWLCTRILECINFKKL